MVGGSQTRISGRRGSFARLHRISTLAPLIDGTAGLGPGVTVAEVIMKPETTALLREASQRGCATVPGRAMLDHQIALATAFLVADRPSPQG